MLFMRKDLGAGIRQLIKEQFPYPGRVDTRFMLL
jgi:hypothetical protein